MTRVWGASGVGGNNRHRIILPEALRQQFEIEIKCAKLTPKFGIEALFADLEKAIALYSSVAAWSESSSPARVRENLTRLRADGLRLNDSFNALDGNSLLLLGEYADVEQLRKLYLQTIISASEKALKNAKSFPYRGRLPQDEKIILVLESAEIFSKHLNLKLVTTRVSPFANLMTLILQEAAGNPELRSIEELLRKSKKWCRTVAEDGVVTFEVLNPE